MKQAMVLQASHISSCSRHSPKGICRCWYQNTATAFHSLEQHTVLYYPVPDGLLHGSDPRAVTLFPFHICHSSRGSLHSPFFWPRKSVHSASYWKWRSAWWQPPFCACFPHRWALEPTFQQFPKPPCSVAAITILGTASMLTLFPLWSARKPAALLWIFFQPDPYSDIDIGIRVTFSAQLRYAFLFIIRYAFTGTPARCMDLTFFSFSVLPRFHSDRRKAGTEHSRNIKYFEGYLRIGGSAFQILYGILQASHHKADGALFLRRFYLIFSGKDCNFRFCISFHIVISTSGCR